MKNNISFEKNSFASQEMYFSRQTLFVMTLFRVYSRSRGTGLTGETITSAHDAGVARGTTLCVSVTVDGLLLTQHSVRLLHAHAAVRRYGPRG